MKSADSQIRAGFQQRLLQHLIHFQIEPVIAIYKTKQISSGKSHSSISGTGKPTIGLVQNLDSSIACLPGIAESRTFVGRPVIH